MKREQLFSNVYKIDASPNGVFFMSYSTPIAMILGKDEWLTTTKHSLSTSRHINKLIGKYIVPSAEPIEQEKLTALAKQAGIDCGHR